MLQCSKKETFADAVKTLAQLDRVPEKRIKLHLKEEEKTSNSGVFNPSMGDLSKTPKAPLIESPRRKRSSISLSRFDARQAVGSQPGLSMCVAEKALLLKSQIVCIQYEILPEVRLSD